jgi:hypothetical protein
MFHQVRFNFEISTAAHLFVYISIERVGSPFVAKGVIIPVQSLQPDLYTLNSSSLAAATAIQVADRGARVPVPVASCNSSACNAVPIDVTSGAVYLSLYGTGFDSVTFLSNISCTTGALTVQFNSTDLSRSPIADFWARPDQSSVAGSVAGTGDVPVQCSFPAASLSTKTNPVHVTIQ